MGLLCRHLKLLRIEKSLSSLQALQVGPRGWDKLKPTYLALALLPAMLGLFAAARRLPAASFVKSFISVVRPRKTPSRTLTMATRTMSLTLSSGSSYRNVSLHLLPRDDNQHCADVSPNTDASRETRLSTAILNSAYALCVFRYWSSCMLVQRRLA